MYLQEQIGPIGHATSQYPALLDEWSPVKAGVGLQWVGEVKRGADIFPYWGCGSGREGKKWDLVYM